MKRFFQKKYVLLSLVLLCSMMSASGSVAAEQEKDLRILFTHDLHASFLPFSILNEQGKEEEVGGYARLKTAIEQNKNDRTIVLDAGDYSMGTFFNMTFESHGSPLVALGELGVEATTIGNHEFDYYPQGLADSLIAARGEKSPQMLVANLEFPETKEAQEIKDAFDLYGAKPYTIIEKDGMKIGLFGLIGANAQSYTETAAPVEFKDYIESAKESVSVLKAQGADVIIALSHTGTSENADKSEDEILAKEVPEIDVIISGHTHTKLLQPIVVGDTIIVSAGNYGENLGVLDITIAEDGKAINHYELIKIDPSIPVDPSMAQMIEEYKSQVESEHLDELGISFDEVITTSTKNFTELEDIENTYGEFDIANLITDAYLYEANNAGIESTLSAVGAGIIRGSFFEGDVTASEIYNVLSLGMGADGSIGFPLVKFYITGEELKNLCEVDVSVSPILSVAQLFFTGVRYTYNENRIIFNKVIDVETISPSGEWGKVKDDELYGVVCSLYMGQMAGMVTDSTYGIIKIYPRDEAGNPLTNLNDAILYDKEGNELKEWVALTHYMQSFADNDTGENVIPAQYDLARENKIKVPTNIITFFSHPNKISLCVYGVLVFFILVIIFMVRFIVKKVKKKKLVKK